jgi:hypothetical protein
MENCMDKREVMLKHDLKGVNSQSSENASVQLLRAALGPLIVEQGNRPLTSDR